MAPRTPDAAFEVPLRLPPGDWDDVLDALGAAAERTSAAIDCDTCATATALPAPRR